MATKDTTHPATLDIQYPDTRDRVSVLLRLAFSIPIMVVLSLLTSSGSEEITTQTNGEVMVSSGGGILGGLFAATLLMILFRQRYPRWWFDFALELNRFSARVSAYLLLLTDTYPSTVDAQSVKLDIAYPDAKKDLNRWLPLVKWLLAIPHYIVLAVLAIGVVFATVIAWFAVVITGKHPRGLFDYVVGVERWALRVYCYAFLLTTDTYPPFQLR